MKNYNFIINVISIGILINFINCQNKDLKPIICGIEKCDLKGGFCSKYLNCSCHNGYLTFFKINDFKCNYKMISKFKSGILELILGFGIGHFYSLRYNFAKFKLCLYLIFIFCCLLSYYYIKKIRKESDANEHPNISIGVLSTICLFILLIFWQLIDCILFWSGFYLDGNGMIMN